MSSFYVRGGNVYILGGRFPALVFWLAVTLLVCPALGSVLERNGVLPVLSWAMFVPGLVLQGQVWRLVTWQFFELSLLPLVFGVLIALFLGRDLHYSWGPRRFLGVLVLVPAAAAGLTTVLALPWAGLRVMPYLTITVLLDIVVVAWATLFPSRQILIYFVLPVAGRTLIYITIGINVLVGLLNGMALVVPHFFAIAIIMLYMRGLSLSRFSTWLKRPGGGASRRSSHLRPVERGEPPRWLH